MQFVLNRNLEEVAAQVRWAAVRAVRMDLLPWTPILDLDVSAPESARAESVVSRAWLLLLNASDVTTSLDDARVGVGFRIEDVCCVGAPREAPTGALEHRYQIRMAHPWSFAIEIIATECVLLRGTRHCPEGSWYLSRRVRTMLESDDEMLDGLRRELPEAFIGEDQGVCEGGDPQGKAP
jgi:hypothetical protein